MILGLKQRFALIYGTTIFAVVIFVVALVITIFNFHFSALNILNRDVMERFRTAFIGIGLIFVPVSAFFSYLVGWIIAQQLHAGRYTITPAAAEEAPVPTPVLEEEFKSKVTGIRQSVDKMREAYDQIQHFSVNASHELRTPLTILRGEVELALRNPKSAEEYESLLGSLLEEIIRLSRTVDDLLLMARSQVGHVTVDAQPVDLRALVEELADEAEIVAAQADVRFVMDGAVDAMVRGDALRLRRMLLNLIDNAVKYNHAGGEVRLALGREGANAVLTISDTGIGIPADALERVFDRFYRVDREHVRGRSGTGLGLSIVRWIVDSHGGTIYLRSAENEGSTFTIRLPLLEASDES
jgi:two-component system, OmpR family, sensor kinase